MFYDIGFIVFIFITNLTLQEPSVHTAIIVVPNGVYKFT